MKILFQGDSITDAGRNRADYYDLGPGYPSRAAKRIKEKFPDGDFEFINLGIGGDQTEDLVKRLERDFIDVAPDLVSILIGINDVWSRAGNKNWLSSERFEANYRKVLSDIKEKTNAKILMLEAFLLPFPDKEGLREDLDRKINIERGLAREFADYYVPLDGLFAQNCVGINPERWSSDGVHPNENGAELIGEFYAAAFEKMMK